MSVGDKHEALMKQDLGVPDGVASLDENGRGAEPPALHASQHAIGGSDPLTAADVGALQNEVFLLSTADARLLDFITAKINGGYTSGVIQIFDCTPPDIPASCGQYALAKYQKHLDNFVEVRVTPDYTVEMNWNKFILGESDWLFPEWVKLATTDYVDALTAADIGAVDRNGYGYYYGNIDTLFDGGTWLILTYETDGMSPATGTLPVTDSWFTLSVFPGGTGSVTQIASAAPSPSAVYHRHHNGVEWSPWQQLATTDYALPRDGSAAMTGDLYIAPDGYSHAALIATASVAQVQAYKSDWTKRRFIHIPTEVSGAAYNDLQFVNMEADARYTILHTGNKPSGSYTGNGDATSRTIETGGKGDAVLINGNGTFTLATRLGAIMCLPAGSTTVTTFTADICKFISGNLTLATSHGGLNANGVPYSYQVL